MFWASNIEQNVAYLLKKDYLKHCQQSNTIGSSVSIHEKDKSAQCIHLPGLSMNYVIIGLENTLVPDGCQTII